MVWLWLVALLLLIVMVCCWALNIVGLPGNWINLGIAALYAWLMPAEHRADFGWIVVGILLLLAVIGELVEFVAGSAGAATAGGSKRGSVLAMIGAIIGGIVGLFVGNLIPIPVVGAVIGSLLLSGLGAMGGAMLGEQWKGRKLEESFWVGHAAFWGRLLGTVGKIAAGAVMIVATTAGLLTRPEDFGF